MSLPNSHTILPTKFLIKLNALLAPLNEQFIFTTGENEPFFCNEPGLLLFYLQRKHEKRTHSEIFKVEKSETTKSPQSKTFHRKNKERAEGKLEECKQHKSKTGDDSRKKKRGKSQCGLPKKMPPGRGLASDVLPAANDRVPQEGRRAHASSIRALHEGGE